MLTVKLWPCCAEPGLTKLMDAAGSTVRVTELLLDIPYAVSVKDAVKTVGVATASVPGTTNATRANVPTTAWYCVAVAAVVEPPPCGVSSI
jgi:hypothetical protein